MTLPRARFLVEGQTEETVVKQVIAPHLGSFGCYDVIPVIVQTSRSASGLKFKGGGSSWHHIRRDLRILLHDTSVTLLTTIFDYYGFPADAPGMSDRPGDDPYDRVRHVEEAVESDVDDGRFVPHLVLHEFESWVLAGRSSLADIAKPNRIGPELDRIVAERGGPELVDDGPATAPSKRIAALWPQYEKVNHGPLVVADLGIDQLRLSCPHAAAWLAKIEKRIDTSSA